MSPTEPNPVVNECTCGWQVPINIAIYGMFFPPVVITFDCPQCGKGFEKQVNRHEGE